MCGVGQVEMRCNSIPLLQTYSHKVLRNRSRRVVSTRNERWGGLPEFMQAAHWVQSDMGTGSAEFKGVGI